MHLLPYAVFSERGLTTLRHFYNIRNVELSIAVRHLGAVAHETRLAIFRLLVRRGSLGLPAGEIASRLDIAPPNASFHLAELSRVGLIGARRDGRNVIYAVDFAVMSGLMDYL